jgi:hypothetical protein
MGRIYSAATLKPLVLALRDEEDWIAGLIPRRSIVVVVGDSGEGKSPLFYQQAFCMASAIDFLGRPTLKARVLIVDFENGLAQMQGMLQQFATYYNRPLPNDELSLLSANYVPAEWESPGHTLIDLIRDKAPDVVLIDSLGSAYPDVEGRNEIANRKYKQFREVISATGTTIGLLLHTKKQSEAPYPNFKPVRLEDGDLRQWFHHHGRGARALINGSDVRLAMEGHSKTDLIMRGFRRVAGELPPMYLKRARGEDGKPLAYEQVAGAGLLFNEEQEHAFAKLDDVFRHTDAKHAYGKGPQATTDWLNKCMDLGIVEKMPDGNYRKSSGLDVLDK